MQIIGDLSTIEGIEHVVKELKVLIEKGIDIGIVINNAGISYRCYFLSMNPH